MSDETPDTTGLRAEDDTLGEMLLAVWSAPSARRFASAAEDVREVIAWRPLRRGVIVADGAMSEHTAENDARSIAFERLERIAYERREWHPVGETVDQIFPPASGDTAGGA